MSIIGKPLIAGEPPSMKLTGNPVVLKNGLNTQSTLSAIVTLPYNVNKWTGTKLYHASKNLLDSTEGNYPIFNGYPSGNQGKMVSSSSYRSTYIPCLPNTTYTVSKTWAIDSDRLGIAYSAVLPEADAAVTFGSYIQTGTVGTRYSQTITTGSSAKYLIMWYGTSNATSRGAITTCTIEYGSEMTTPFSEYAGPTISVDWSTIASNVYGGTFDFVSGLLTSSYASDGTALSTPVTYQLAHNNIPIGEATNTYYSYDNVNIEVVYTSLTLPSTDTFTAISNGTYNAPAGSLYWDIVVNVPNTYSSSDEGKVISNGALVSQTNYGTVTQNGTIDTTLNNSVTVSVSGSSVNVQTSKSYTATAIGSQTISPDTGYDAMGEVALTVTPSLKMGVLRPDAEKVQTWSADYLVHTDKGVTIPSYSTTGATLVSAESLTPTYTLACNSYYYYILLRCLTIPQYSVTTKAKGRFEWSYTSAAYEIVDIPANSLESILDSKQYTSSNIYVFATGVQPRALYWSSGTAVAVYNPTSISTSSYGVNQAITAPAVSSNTSATATLTITSPSVVIRGSTTYLVNTYYNAISDIRAQYIIELWRVPLSSLSLDGWGITSQAHHIINCINDSTHKLT